MEAFRLQKCCAAGPTNPHTRCVFGGSRVKRQVAGTNGEALTFGRGLLLFWASAGALNQFPSARPISSGFNVTDRR